MNLEIIKLIDPRDSFYETVEQLNADAHKILCFDLEEFPFKAAIAWINRIREFDDEEGDVIIPCTMLLTALESTLSSTQIEEALNAGTVLYERPTNSSNVSALKILFDLEREIKNSESAVEVDTEKRSGPHLGYNPLSHGEADIDGDDFELFANPIAQIDDESFKRLLERLQMRDNSWKKDD